MNYLDLFGSSYGTVYHLLHIALFHFDVLFATGRKNSFFVR